MSSRPIYIPRTGIKISINSNDHPPRHFHARKGGLEGRFYIPSARIMDSALDRNDNKRVQKWAVARKTFLRRRWRRTHPKTR